MTLVVLVIVLLKPSGSTAVINGARHSPRSAVTGEQEREAIGGPGEVGTNENQTPDLRVTQQEQDGAAYLPFLDGADAKIMMAHIHNKPMAIRIAQEHLKAVRNDFKYDTKGVPGRLSEAQITTYHHAVFKEFNANTRFYGGTLFTGESNGNFAKAWKWSLSWAYCGLSCDSN